MWHCRLELTFVIKRKATALRPVRNEYSKVSE